MTQSNKQISHKKHPTFFPLRKRKKIIYILKETCFLHLKKLIH